MEQRNMASGLESQVLGDLGFLSHQSWICWGSLEIQLLKFLTLKQECHPCSILPTDKIYLPLVADVRSQKYVFLKCPLSTKSHQAHSQQRASAWRRHPSSRAKGQWMVQVLWVPNHPVGEKSLIREWHWLHTRRYSHPCWSRVTSSWKCLQWFKHSHFRTQEWHSTWAQFSNIKGF